MEDGWRYNHGTESNAQWWDAYGMTKPQWWEDDMSIHTPQRSWPVVQYTPRARPQVEIEPGVFVATYANRPETFEQQYTIHAYWSNGTWMYDDPRPEVPRVREAFVMGADKMIDAMIAMRGIKRRKARKHGVNITFSAEYFDGAQFVADHVGADTFDWGAAFAKAWSEEATIASGRQPPTPKTTTIHGNYYEIDIGSKRMRGWFCPAIMDFFPEPPKRIFAAVEMHTTN